jgi:ABC-type transporter Mla subunit MlaD
VGDPGSIFSILWSSDPEAQRCLWMLLGLLGLSILTVYGPLAVRLVQLFLLERHLATIVFETRHRPGRSGAPGVDRDAVRDTLADSAIAEAWADFERRWSTAQLSEAPERAPIRLADVLDDRPLLPFGPRRSLLPILPGLFVAFGVFGALLELIPSLASLAADEAPQSTQAAWMATQVSVALRATAWGFLCAIGTALAGRLIEGGFAARSGDLDVLVEHAFGAVSPGELAELTRQTQQRSLETLGKELTQFSNELNERLDRGLQRIEQSTARSASLVSQEQRGALHTVVQELSLSVRQGVEHHLAELRGALQRAIEHQGSVTNGLAEAFEKMVENAKTQDRVARSLADSADAVDEAARSMRSSAGEMQPVLEHLGTTSAALAETAARITDTQQVVARTAETVRSSLEFAASGVDDQRTFIERSLGEIRRTLVGLGDGLGEMLQRSLREVDDALGSTVGQLRDTLAESNETIDRLAVPIRAAEGTTRETHVALDRVRSEVEALGQWMSQAVKPLRSGLDDVEGRTEDIARAITEFTSHARQIDKTMQALRDEIHEESRRLQSAGSDLGRRLTQTADAVGMLETTTSDAVRRVRPDGSLSRDRSWSPAPSDPTPPRERTAAREPVPPGDDATTADPPRTPLSDAAGVTSTATETQPPAPAADGLGSDLTRSGYRLGSPRAKGPDPYARFDGDDALPMNVRHFPTRDRELGDELKLAGLLGPSGPDPKDPSQKPDPEDDDEASMEER